MIAVTIFAGKKIAVFGLGMSGIAAAKALAAGGADVAVWDDNENGLKAAREAGFAPVDLKAADWDAFAALVLAPGVPLTHPKPHWTVERAQAAGVEVIGDTELFCRQRRAQNSKAKVIAITGTNGKSTTTALSAHLVAASGRRVAMGGNIGRAILDLDPLADDLTYVIEYSSYQIDLTPTLDPNAAALLNITPDHLDRHGTLEHYAYVKSRLFARLGAGDTAVIGVDDAPSAAIADALTGPATVKRISVLGPVEDGVFDEGHALIDVAGGVRQPPLSLEGIGSLRGSHNAQNAATAYALCRAIGLTREEIAAGLASFPGLAHRMEQVGRLGHVLFINDSKATNADAAAKALASFGQIYWIAGGLAKAGGLAGLEGFYPKIRRAYFIGAAAEDFGRFVDGRLGYTISGTLDAAVAEAARDAAASGDAEPVVLLSPACASFDQYPNFMIRGDAFRARVIALGAVQMQETQAA
ncbi:MULTISPECIES: UDP-N-acetylmuramoyl-L-alanine--D-glutamate ligase [Rhodomicrobium]|uniref:UDP-N-acetylmuramoyl-L-alanine--D-glutamate ligase n=1 Tax=Rhodomicrobium TaxID=1068 RepID=UPI000B4BBD74|nr:MULTISPECIES: UDP-N-acetylmuramoyl-L-alanine--D-glutamate ligase [Rhodomicrobium]